MDQLSSNPLFELDQNINFVNVSFSGILPVAHPITAASDVAALSNDEDVFPSEPIHRKTS
jgi:hypothetical protein